MLLAATALAALAASSAHAEDGNSTGRWLDTARHIDISDLPDNSEAVGRLNYAKEACNPGRPSSVRPGYDKCMRSYGFKFIFDTPTQIAAREKGIQDERNREMGRMIGNALLGAAQSMQQHSCNGTVNPGGNFNMNCY
jgi:hypothetical protein